MCMERRTGGPGMVYVVRAIRVDGVTGAFTAEKNTLCGAKESAQSLRKMGLWVIIIGPDGKTIDETKKTLEHAQRRQAPGTDLGVPLWRSGIQKVAAAADKARRPKW